jgi:hypothetical protein
VPRHALLGSDYMLPPKWCEREIERAGLLAICMRITCLSTCKKINK